MQGSTKIASVNPGGDVVLHGMARRFAVGQRVRVGEETLVITAHDLNDALAKPESAMSPTPRPLNRRARRAMRSAVRRAR